MDVSVIFATHNRADILPEVFEAWRQVDSVTRYSYEIICSDDDSDDDTVDVIEGISDLPVRLIKNKKGGAGRARNAAIEMARGKIVIFTGDDIFPSPDFINLHYENYLKFGDTVATLGRIDWHPDIRVNQLMHHITEVGCEQFGFIGLPVYQLIDFRHFYTSNISVPMKMLRSIDKLFSPEFDRYGYEDIELGYRLQQNGLRIYYDPDILVTHHHVYDSVDKFIARQESSGEELVVFAGLHDDLQDKCIIDVKNLQGAVEEYKSRHINQISIKGKLILCILSLMSSYAKKKDMTENRRSTGFSQKALTVSYQTVFKFAVYHGVVRKLCIQNRYELSDERIYDFLVTYFKEPYSEIYWDTGRGFNEQDARKWVWYEKDYGEYSSIIMEDAEKLRFAPLKDRCIAEIDELYFGMDNGSRIQAKLGWHNACRVEGNRYDFSNTNDPCIMIDDVPDGVRELVVKQRIRKKSTMRQFAGKIKRLLRPFVNRGAQVRRRQKDWEPLYAYGQKRRIQIGIGGSFDSEEKEFLIEEYRKQVSMFGDDVHVSDIDHMMRGYSDYIYEPSKSPIDKEQFLQVIYALLNQVVDYVIVSGTLDDYPYVGCDSIQDACIYSSMLSADQKESLADAEGLFLRLPGYSVKHNIEDLTKTYKGCLYNGKRLSSNQSRKPVFRQSKRDFSFVSEKPVVFVVPVFLAVGGVERNTIEIMRVLAKDYTFCMITLERHAKEQGTLHYQLEGICDYIFDLAELTDFDNYAGVLYELKAMFKPEVLWLCNNSPWLEKNIGIVRNIYRDVAMVAQDVYDTKLGWIEYYDSPGMQSFDRYIAVTEKIRNCFVDKYGISENKIDVIYSAVDSERLAKEKMNKRDRKAILHEYGITEAKYIIAYVGRLTEQKNPLRYLKLAKQTNQKRNDVRFVMVGDGKLNTEVDEYISKNELGGIVKRIPYLANTAELIGTVDALAITSDYEGLPIVSIEAMCMGTPVLSTDTGDLRRFIEKYGNGVILDDKDDYESLSFLIDNIDEMKKKAENSGDEALAFFSAENLGEQYRSSFISAKKALNYSN